MVHGGYYNSIFLYCFYFSFYYTHTVLRVSKNTLTILHFFVLLLFLDFMLFYQIFRVFLQFMVNAILIPSYFCFIVIIIFIIIIIIVTTKPIVRKLSTFDIFNVYLLRQVNFNKRLLESLLRIWKSSYTAL